MMATLTEIAGQQLGLALGMNPERRAFGHPDGSIFFGGLFRADVEDDAVQDQPPHRARDFDDARVGQELPQVTLEGRRCWRFADRRIGRMSRA